MFPKFLSMLQEICIKIGLPNNAETHGWILHDINRSSSRADGLVNPKLMNN